MNKKVIRDFLPPVLFRLLSGLFYGWHGNYSSWEDAKKRCTGYDSMSILNKVKASAQLVKEGKAAYERDSVVFERVEYSYPILSGLMWIATQNNCKLNVLDFGGSLGSSYYQNKYFLDTLIDCHWCIVEQPDFVSEGLQNFSNRNLHFFHSIDECLKSFNIDVILLSSVLQYLEFPYNLLEQIKCLNFKYIIIDRTPFITGEDRITVQRVNKNIYRGSYPCWFFSKAVFISKFTGPYKLIDEFDSLDKANISSEFKGFIFQKV